MENWNHKQHSTSYTDMYACTSKHSIPPVWIPERIWVWFCILDSSFKSSEEEEEEQEEEEEEEEELSMCLGKFENWECGSRSTDT